jgi:hypothetical protein
MTVAPPVLTIHAPCGSTKPLGTHIGAPNGDNELPGACGGHALTGSIFSPISFWGKNQIWGVGGASAA